MLSWIVFGDFNEVLHSREMEGARDRNMAQMRHFSDALLECGLRDLGCKGDQFSFSNRRTGVSETRVRLDRCVANSECCRQFPSSLVSLGFANVSDLKPLVIELETVVPRRRVQRNFKFEPVWLRDANFKDIVSNCWEESSGIACLSGKLKRCGDILQAWKKRKFGNVQNRIKRLKEVLNFLKANPRSGDSSAEESKVSNELDEWLARDELLWKQRARSDWLKEGDMNATFFRAKASQRKVGK